MPWWLVPREGELSPIRKIIAKIIVTRSGSCCHLQSAITTCIRSSATNNHMEINSENFQTNKFSKTTIPIRFKLFPIFLTVRHLFHMFAVLSIPSLLNFDNSQLRHEKKWCNKKARVNTIFNSMALPPMERGMRTVLFSYTFRNSVINTYKKKTKRL